MHSASYFKFEFTIKFIFKLMFYSEARRSVLKQNEIQNRIDKDEPTKIWSGC